MDINVQVAAGGRNDDDSTAVLVAALRQEVESLEVGRTRMAQSAESGGGPSRAGDFTDLTAFIIALPPTLHALRALLQAIDHWVSGSARSVSLKVGGDMLEVRGGSGSEQAALVRSWIERRSIDPGAQ